MATPYPETKGTPYVSQRLSRREFLCTLGRSLCLGALGATIARSVRRGPDVKCSERLCDQCPVLRTCPKPQAQRTTTDSR